MVTYADNVQIRLEGLDDKLKFNIYERLSGLRKTNIDLDQYFQSKVNYIVLSCLRALGYYSPDIKFFLYRISSPRFCCNCNDYILIVQVHSGSPIRVSEINVVLTGDISTDSDYQKLLSEVKLLIGTVLNHNEYDNFKKKLLNLSLSKGYFDAKFCKNQLLVMPDCYQSFWNIFFDSGKRYCFGETKFYGGQIKKKYLKNLSNISSGTYFDNQLLIEFNRRLSATNWFNSVIISPHFVVGRESMSILPVDIDVFLVPSIVSNFEVSVGYSSDVSSRFKIIWKKPCFNVYGHSIETIVNISMLEQFIDINYKIPLVKSPLQEYYLLQLGVRYDNFSHRKFDSIVMMNIARYWDSSTGWKRGYNFRYYFDHYDQLSNFRSKILIYPGISMNRIRQRGGMMPVWGDSQYYSINVSSRLWKSSIDFFLFQAQNTWIRTLFYKHRLVIRNYFGLIESSDYQFIFPFMQRFFFVGNHFVRGYKYHSLFCKSILLDSVSIVSKLMINSLEYQYNFFDKWWGVLFIDGGRVVKKNISDNFYFKYGFGFGIRWKSPVGPIKLDIAIPLFCDQGDRIRLFHIYVGLGSEL